MHIPDTLLDGVEHLLTDSRSLTAPAATLFVALRTPSGDGHKYVEHLYNDGVRRFLVEHPVPLPPDAHVAVVPDTGAALLELGRRRRDLLQHATVIAITGSRGKTTVKEWLYAVLSGHARTCRSPRSYNSRVGVPLSLWEADPQCRYAIVEAGISRRGEMQVLRPVIRPDMVVLTSITDEHDDGFASRREKIAEKMVLAEGTDVLVYPLELADYVPTSVKRRVSYSLTDAAATFYGDVQGTQLTLHHPGGAVTLPLPFTDEALLLDLLATAAAVYTLGVDPMPTLAHLEPVDTRLDVVEGTGGCMLVSDTFTADIASLATALDFTRRRLTPGKHLTAVIGSLQGDYAVAARLLRQAGVTRILGVGAPIAEHAALLGDNLQLFPDVDALLTRLSAADFANELILVKGAPADGLSRLVDMLEARQHQTILEVNLDALVRNFNFFRARLRPGTDIVAMVKAYGYGAGSFELAKTLQEHGAAYLAVAAHDEGVALRRQGITMPIMVLNPRVENYSAMFSYRLEPEIYSFEMLDTIIGEARKWGVTDYPVHLKLDTGMHRLGFEEQELPQVAARLASTTGIRLRSVFTHLAAADDPAEDDYTRMQFDIFNRSCDTLARALRTPFLRHVLNTAGIMRFPEEQHDMVRLGIGLYGIPILRDGSMAALEPVSTLSCVVIALRRRPAGTTIGYNRRGRLTRDSLIATIPVGYADGINRRLGYGNLHVLVNGVPCPTVGSICMDVMMVDVTDAPDVRVGTRVELFGRHNTALSIADGIDTIPYEILTSVAQRVKRIYYRE